MSKTVFKNVIDRYFNKNFEKINQTTKQSSLGILWFIEIAVQEWEHQSIVEKFLFKKNQTICVKPRFDFGFNINIYSFP